MNQITSSTGLGRFEPLLDRWLKIYGASAVPALLQLASSEDLSRTLGRTLGKTPGSGPDELSDPQRYVALMGVARLGGKPMAPKIVGFLKDPSWLLRSGALRALEGIQDANASGAVLPLLHDPSLVVRLEAVRAISKLKPAGAAEALVQALASEENYRRGKALWVPGRVLAALVALRASQVAHSLRPLLDHQGDPDLLLETVATLEMLTGRVLKPKAPLSVRVSEWKLALNSR